MPVIDSFSNSEVLILVSNFTVLIRLLRTKLESEDRKLKFDLIDLIKKIFTSKNSKMLFQK